MFDEWRQDLRRAGRGLLRAKGFTAAAVLTFALGMAGTSVMFALVHGVLLRPLPIPAQDRLVVGWKEFPSGAVAHWPFRSREIETIGRESRLFERVSGASYYPAAAGVVYEHGRASYLRSASVMGGFFDVVGAAPLLGRTLGRADDVTSAENVLVISHALWRRRYGGSRDAIGRRLMIGEQPFTIVGVMPADFDYPRGVEAWMTLSADASKEMNPAFREGILRDVDFVARLRPGVSPEQAQGELQRFVTALEAGLPADSPRALRPVLRLYRDVVVGDVRSAMLALFAAVGLVLAIASANVANLLLLRSESRRHELAVRAALGAGRARLARMLFAESALLALAAGLGGLLVTAWLLPAVVALVPGGLPRVESVRLDGAVVLFTFAVTAAAAALAGTAPALFAASIDLASQLRGGRQLGGGAGARHGRRALVVAQVALAMTVVAAAGLLTRSLLQLQAVDMGLAAGRLVFADLGPAATKRPERARALPQFLDAVVARLEASPGIEGATAVNTPPFAGTGGWDLPQFTAEGQGLAEAEKNPALNLESVRPNYFATLQVPLLRGRVFTEDDRSGAPEVAIVSEDLAARIWPGQDPIGRRLKFGRPDFKDPWRTVVGVVKPTRYRELSAPRPTLYLPGAQFIMSAPMLVLRTSLPLPQAAALARAHVQAVDPNVEVLRVRPFAELLQLRLARPRFDALLIDCFGLVALLLAGVGLYAVMAVYVRQRSPEIGIRIALGASRSDVRRLVLDEVLRLAALGAALGLAGAAAASGLLRSLLFGVRPLDPPALVAAALLLVGVCAVASYLPARRATRVDPVAVLRAE
jgi:putative ABC transport system permease protein